MMRTAVSTLSPGPARFGMRALLVSVFLAGAVVPAAAGHDPRAGGAAHGPSYRLRVRVEPAADSLEARAEIEHPGRLVFMLSRDLRIRRILADGGRRAFREDSARDGLRTVTLAGPVPRRLVVEYGGRIEAASYPKLVSQVNGVVPGRVELASYVGWYPRLEHGPAYTFDLQADVPAGYTALTNGRAVGRGQKLSDRWVTEWRSYGPVADIVLLAAPGLRGTAASGGGARVEVYASELPAAYVDSMSRDVAAAGRILADLLGSRLPVDVVRVAYSPRPGWGYVRAPLIIVSEQNALSTRATRFGRARDLRYIAHEVAHYWWHRADVGTPEDWINEGLAEYSALLAVERLVGPAFRDTLLQEYAERSAGSPVSPAILETGNDSPDRELNRYVRPVLLLQAARQRAGEAAMMAFLEALNARFTAADRATTTDLLQVAAATLGPAERDSLSAALHRTRWGEAASSAYVFLARDSLFLGTWTGTLTQAGATNAVVLHLVVRADTLRATIDSPDQGVQGIPVPTVRISGDTLLFGLGSVGVSYQGRLDAVQARIAGQWKQGGASFPLVLRRSTSPP